MRKILTGLMLLILATSGAFAQDSKAKTKGDLYEELDLLMDIFQRVRTEYVDEVEDTEVLEAAIQGMLQSLDPHSHYFNASKFEDVNEQMTGEYGGLGMEITSERGIIKVISPIDETPAERAGIKGGDFITHLDGVSIVGQSTDQAVTSMRGAAGEPITLTIVREGESEPLEITLVRAVIKLKSVRHRIESDTIGYIRVSTFNISSGADVEKAITAIKEEVGDSLEGIVLDVRNNPGGLLTEAIRISDAFLDHGEIVSTRGRHDYNNSRAFAEEGDMIDGLPIVVLINGSSASASEIVAGALQDHRRAVILGDKTFGKGTVQSEMRLGRQGDRAIRLTTAKYYTPSGRSIQGRGIEPDIEVLFTRKNGELYNSRRESDIRGSFTNDQETVDRTGEDANDKEAPDTRNTSSDTSKDFQLERAVALLKSLKATPAPAPVMADASNAN